jgi:ubiquinone/menaquinone biosynthesis C-methylase UbiE
MTLTDDFEVENFQKYSGAVYHAKTITALPPEDSPIYSEILLWAKFDLIKKYSNNGAVLDLCCGTGEHLMHLSKFYSIGKGLDFSKPFVEQANQTKIDLGRGDLEFLEGNARKMPFEDRSFDMVYCLSALYHIPKVEEVVREISRVLKQKGYCVLDLGNLYSLNTIACQAYPELAHTFHIPVSKMKAIMNESGLKMVERHCFQILPMWAIRPKWMAPLNWQGWTKLLAKKVKGRMLDEWISSLPILRFFSFRHLFVCQKTE